MFNLDKIKKLSFILLAVLVLLIFLHHFGILQPIENLIVDVVSPIQQGTYFVGSKINNTYGNFSTKTDLIASNKDLEKEVKRLIVENSQLRMQIQEFEEMNLQAEFLDSQRFQAIIAKVIGRNPQPGRQAIILDKGSRHGIKKDMPVITANGIMVGKIIESFGNISHAVLVNDPHSQIAAMVENEHQSKGVVTGEHGIGLRMELILQNEIVNENDVVITSGLEFSIPKGLVIGKINRVLNEPNNFFQVALIQSLAKIDGLTMVSVLINRDYDENPN